MNDRIRQSFDRQGLMITLGATLEHVSDGVVHISIRPHPSISQQHGFVHAGAVAAIADSAAGYAALTLMPPGRGVLTVEFKINLLAPAAGERLVARGRVIRSGRQLTVCRGDAVAVSEGREKHVATMTATLIAVTRPDSASRMRAV